MSERRRGGGSESGVEYLSMAVHNELLEVPNDIIPLSGGQPIGH
jgi:hypothetical protein